jgi:transposase
MLNKLSLLHKPIITLENVSQNKKEVTILWQEILFLRKEVIRLDTKQKSLIEKNRTNSKNSSLAPSQDPHKKKIKKKRITKSKRSQGAQVGHKGVGRKLVSSIKVDHIQNCLPVEDCCSKSSIVVQFDSYTRFQQLELPEIKPEITEYRLVQGICNQCKKKHEGHLPAGTPTGMLGPNAMATVCSLTGDYRISRRESQRLLKNHFHLSLSLGTISNIEHEVSKSLKPVVEEAREAVKKEKIVHADETSHKESGKKQWMWVAVTSFLSVFMIHPTRSTVAAKELLGELFSGFLVTDRYSSYNWVDLAKRQFCWAHLIRDIIKISERGGLDYRIGQLMLFHVKWMFILWYKVREKELSRTSFQAAMKFTKKSIEDLLLEGTKSSNKLTQGSCRKILKQKLALWTFIDVEGLEPTNNIAERTIRAYVLWRKMSFGSQSERGNRFIERMMTVRASCKQQERTISDFIKRSIRSYYGAGETPSLLPSEKSSNTKSA